jgi:hypothetical protein
MKSAESRLPARVQALPGAVSHHLPVFQLPITSGRLV